MFIDNLSCIDSVPDLVMFIPVVPVHFLSFLLYLSFSYVQQTGPPAQTGPINNTMSGK